MGYTTPTQKVIRFTSDEYLKIGEVAERFWKRGVTGDPHTLAVFMGGVGGSHAESDPCLFL